MPELPFRSSERSHARWRIAPASIPTLALVLSSLVACAAACSSGSADGKAAAGGASDTTGAGGAAGGAGGTSTAGGSAGAAGMPGGGAAGAGGSDPCGGQEFVALLPDFLPYQTWTSFYVEQGVATFNEMGGPRTIYINQLPPKGASVFPVGTIIVKVIDDGTGVAGAQQIFAMVKRGACFNGPDGAVGWEWFGLDTMSGALAITWRGTAPPPSAGYGPKGDCNGCHAILIVEPNDYVQDSFLQLHPPLIRRSVRG